jgi:L-ascorbate metabolism protein UlaG (beta-lactamase superfamily)
MRIPFLTVSAALALLATVAQPATAQTKAAPTTKMPPPAPAGKTQVEWYGHAAFKVTTPSGKVLLIDPWLTNPLNATGAADVAGMNTADLILISHGHNDHIGDAVKIAQQTKAKLVAPFDLGQALNKFSGFPAEQSGMDTQGNIGGRLVLLDGEVTIQFTPAMHASTVTDGQSEPHAAGNPCGFLIMIKGGPTIYHTGDTGLFSDMALLPKVKKVDVMLCCIGDHFVMGPDQAAEAVRLVQPTTVVPMHYGTFPALPGTAAEFRSALQQRGLKTRVEVMDVHQVLTF